MVSWQLATSVLAAVAVLGSAMAALLAISERRRAARYDRERHRIEIESLRKSLESKIYNLSDRLVATEERWRDANHLVINSQKLQAEGERSNAAELTPFLRNAGFKSEDLIVDPKQVFVLTPFHSEFDATYDLILDVCRDAGLRALRGDEEFIGSSDIFTHILRLIVKSRIVIANLDGRNPNVFYELGIAQSMNKPTILVGSSLSDIPFDIQSRKIVLASDKIEMRKRLQREITRTLIEN